jgi:DNA-binding IclR family transcriptional regulator
LGNEALTKALRVLGCFDWKQPEWSVAELSRRTGLNKSHVVKILREFVCTQYLEQDSKTRRYRVGPNSLSLGTAYLCGSNLLQCSSERLRRIAQDTGQTTTLSVVDRSGVLFLLRVDGRAGAHPTLSVGSHVPLHATSAGKICAALLPIATVSRLIASTRLEPITPSTIRDPHVFWEQLDGIRRSGFACTFGESTFGVGGIATPILGEGQNLLGALSVLFNLQDETASQRRGLVSTMLAAGRQVSFEMGASSYPF